jgi:hypothetical protein
MKKTNFLFFIVSLLVSGGLYAQPARSYVKVDGETYSN